MATKNYLHNYRLTKTGSNFSVINTGSASDYGPANVTDDGTNAGGDNPNILGDVASDQFNNSAAVVTGRPSTYIGSSNGTSGDFVATYNNGNQTNYFLYTNTARTNSTPVTFNTAQTTAICFADGTRILTATGEVAVEDLRVGDLAVTASGAHRPIRWIGSRLTQCRRHRDPTVVMPVRIRAGALGANRPVRDLLVSPGHAICLDVLGEVLILAIDLVNGATIVQEDVDRVTYWHVELDSHDILVADGQPAESYLDMDNRRFFSENGVIDISAVPDAATRTHADFCRPLHGQGALVDAVRAQLRARAETLGWTCVTPGTWTDVYLDVDGRVVRPKANGLSACFLLPADAQDVWLVCPTSIPSQVGTGADLRALGLCLSGLTLDDGLREARTIALDDPLLCVGFHDPSEGHRWTTGRARIPAALLTGLDGDTFLRVSLAVPLLPRWVAHEAAAADDIEHEARQLNAVAA